MKVSTPAACQRVAQRVAALMPVRLSSLSAKIVSASMPARTGKALMPRCRYQRPHRSEPHGHAGQAPFRCLLQREGRGVTSSSAVSLIAPPPVGPNALRSIFRPSASSAVLWIAWGSFVTTLRTSATMQPWRCSLAEGARGVPAQRVAAVRPATARQIGFASVPERHSLTPDRQRAVGALSVVRFWIDPPNWVSLKSGDVLVMVVEGRQAEFMPNHVLDLQRVAAVERMDEKPAWRVGVDLDGGAAIPAPMSGRRDCYLVRADDIAAEALGQCSCAHHIAAPRR